MSSGKGTEYGKTVVRLGSTALKGGHPDFARLYAGENGTRHKSISSVPLCTH